MVYETFLQDGINKIFKEGKTVSVKIFTGSIVAGSAIYDDDTNWAQSGTTLWSSGLLFPISNKQGSSEPVLIEQGKLLTTDKKLYLNNTFNLSGDGITLGLGSPPTQIYSVIPEGVIQYNIGDTVIYQKVYIRQLLGGSLF